MEQSLNLQEVRSKIAEFIGSVTLDQRVAKTLMSAEGFVPKESELWDYKATANGDALSKAKTVMQIVSFYNAYGGYIVYGVLEDGSKERYLAKGISPKCINPQQIGMLIKEYTGESIDFSYREVPLRINHENLLFGILHVPKRPAKQPPIFFAKNGPDTKPHLPLFQKDHAYVRLQDNCVAATDKKALQFLFGPRELEFVENRKRPTTTRGLILDHNLPDRDVICPRFFGRDEIIERLWMWLSDQFSTTRVLAGDGGRGKTSIAYEFCEEVCRARPFELSRVFWVTAKQKQFSATLNEYRYLPETHFTDLESLLRALCLGYAMLDTEVDDLALTYQKRNLQAALRLFPSLVVVDDIDSVEDLNEQKRILELCSAISAGTPSRFLLTTRMNLTSSTDVCLKVPGLGQDEYKPYVDYLVEKLNGAMIGKKELHALWEATDGSPLFTESVLRLLKQGMRLNQAITTWNGKLGEEVRMAALEREIQKLSLEARRVLLTCAYMVGGASMIELKQVTGYDDARMTRCIAELTSLFLLGAPDFIKKVPRFQVPTNTAKLILERQKELVTDPEGLRRTIQNLRGRNNTLNKIDRSGGAIAQMYALMRDGRFDDAIKTIEAAVKQLGQTPELIMHCGKCYFEKARQTMDAAANTAARKWFKKSYDLGQRKSYLFECWFQSELEADHPGGAIEVAELAIQNKIEPLSEWVLKRSASLEKLARRHVQSHNPQEALTEFERSVADMQSVLKETESHFQRENLRTRINRVNDERVDLVCRISRDFSGWEQAVETIVSIVDSGDVRPSHAFAAVNAFDRMVDRTTVYNITNEIRTRRHLQMPDEEEGPRKYQIAAIHNRRKDIRRLLSRIKFLNTDERSALESKMKTILLLFEADLSKTATT